MNKNKIRSQRNRLSLALLLSIGLTACGGGGGSSSTPAHITSFELLDPTPGVSDRFGNQVIILPNGNIVVTDPADSSISTNNGAVHLYNPRSQKLIASIYGDNADGFFGEKITALSNNNFVITSPSDDVSGIADAGSVRLINGGTGAQIGVAIVGDNIADFLGVNGITVLENNNFVIASSSDDVAGIANAGSVRLVNGGTGAQIGAVIVGDDTDDQVGKEVTTLGNNNFVISSGSDDVVGIIDAGSVHLVNGSTGAQIGAAIVGDNLNDQFGESITALANNNFVIASRFDDVAGIADVGSVRLVNGSTGAQIGVAFVGDTPSDLFGGSITALANNNFVIASSSDDVAGIASAGSVRLVNGSTGAQIGADIVGDNLNDQFGERVTALENNNFVIASRFDDVAGIVNAGSARLVNGSTGAKIGTAIVGDNFSDLFGRSITALENNNFVIVSSDDDVAGTSNAGSVRLVNGSMGVQVGAAIVGDNIADFLGSNGIAALANNNFVIASGSDDVAGISDAGSVRLISGSTGARIGAAIVGDNLSDMFGSNKITVLGNNNFVIAAPSDDVESITDAGSIRLVNGNTGAQIGDLIVGSVEGDMASVSITVPANDDYYIMALPFADNNGSVDSGLVRLIAP